MYEFETYAIIPREELGQGALENRLHRKTFELRRQAISGRWRILIMMSLIIVLFIGQTL
jgi:hypothetical protein